MIKFMMASAVSALCLSLPAMAQTFTHTHGATGHYSHDITTYSVSGSCCCPTQSSTELQGAAHPTARTYVRRYTHPTIERRTYSRVVEPHAARTYTRSYSTLHSSYRHHEAERHTSYEAQHREHVLSHDERRERDYALAGEAHSDRARAWAHYDRKWRSRTNDKRH